MTFRPRLASSGRTDRLLRCLRRFARARGGVTSVEFAFVAPVAIGILMAIAEYGVGFYLQMETQQAAQAGAEYAVMHGFVASAPSSDPRSPAGISNVVVNATLFSTVNASPAPYSYCGCASASGVVHEDCNETCSDGTAAGTYLTVSASGIYRTLLPYPLIPKTYNLTGLATVRIQ